MMPSNEETMRWWLVIPSDELMKYLEAARDGEDPSLLLARIYLEAENADDS